MGEMKKKRARGRQAMVNYCQIRDKHSYCGQIIGKIMSTQMPSFSIYHFLKVVIFVV